MVVTCPHFPSQIIWHYKKECLIPDATPPMTKKANGADKCRCQHELIFPIFQTWAANCISIKFFIYIYIFLQKVDIYIYERYAYSIPIRGFSLPVIDIYKLN